MFPLDGGGIQHKDEVACKLDHGNSTLQQSLEQKKTYQKKDGGLLNHPLFQGFYSIIFCGNGKCHVFMSEIRQTKIITSAAFVATKDVVSNVCTTHLGRSRRRKYQEMAKGEVLADMLSILVNETKYSFKRMYNLVVVYI